MVNVRIKISKQEYSSTFVFAEWFSETQVQIDSDGQPKLLARSGSMWRGKNEDFDIEIITSLSSLYWVNSVFFFDSKKYKCCKFWYYIKTSSDFYFSLSKSFIILILNYLIL